LDVGVCVTLVDAVLDKVANVEPSVDTSTVYPVGVAPAGADQDIVTQLVSVPPATVAFSVTVIVGFPTLPSGVLLRNDDRIVIGTARVLPAAPVVTSYAIVPAYEARLNPTALPKTLLIPVNVMLPEAGTDIYFTSPFFQTVPSRLQ
jgi:hypothetical protein